jgi:hypothetical protein
MSPRHRHYRAPTKPLLTAWSRHLDAVMRERDLSQTNVFDEVRDELGYASTSRSAIVRVFSDKEPDARQAEVLARHYGTPPVGMETPTPGELSLQERAVRAAERQADALEAILGVLSGRTPLDRAAVAASLAAATLAGEQSPLLESDPLPDRE